MNLLSRTLLAVLSLVTVSGIIVWIFWKTELVYSLPTPLPTNYIAVERGSQINLGESFSFLESKPILVHFFNPECPCSRFNIPHVKELIKKYGSRINFVMVVINNKNHYSEKEIQEEYDLSIPVSFNEDIAFKCGVYSTPQAVVIDENHELYFRGNYNRNRYCTNKESEFVKMAIDSLLNNVSLPDFSKQATVAYGCKLSLCTK